MIPRTKRELREQMPYVMGQIDIAAVEFTEFEQITATENGLALEVREGRVRVEQLEEA